MFIGGRRNELHVRRADTSHLALNFTISHRMSVCTIRLSQTEYDQVIAYRDIHPRTSKANSLQCSNKRPRSVLEPGNSYILDSQYL